jgi:hypothetical protein
LLFSYVFVIFESTQKIEEKKRTGKFLIKKKPAKEKECTVYSKSKKNK